MHNHSAAAGRLDKAAPPLRLSTVGRKGEYLVCYWRIKVLEFLSLVERQFAKIASAEDQW